MFEFSKHTTDQSIKKGISVHETKEAIFDGEVIENYPDDKYGPSCLIFGLTSKGRPLNVQCSYPQRTLVKIITLYRTESDRWINFRRKKMCRQYQEYFVERKVTYTLELKGRIYIVASVPARVNPNYSRK